MICVLNKAYYLNFKGFEDCTILNKLLEEYDHDLKTVIKTFTSRRIQDAEAISDLALYNYIEVIIFFFFIIHFR
jgi:hypothetical protein